MLTRSLILIGPNLIAAIVAALTAIGMAAKIHVMTPVAVEQSALWLAVFHHDAEIFGALILVYVLAGFVGVGRFGNFFATGLRLLIACVLGLYLADLLAYWLFTTRLYWSDIVTFKGELAGIKSLARSVFYNLDRMSTWRLGAIALVGMTAAICVPVFVIKHAAYSTFVRNGLAAFAIALLVFASFSFPPSVYSHADKPLYENFVERNVDYLKTPGLSAEYREYLIQNYAESKSCIAGGGQRRDIIIVVVESLSAYHSDYFSGLNDFTPNLDSLAMEYSSLINFHSNGWTTIGGLISILTSSFPIVPETADFNTWGSPRFKDFSSPAKSLPNLLKSHGYSTKFVGAGDLSFMEQGRWLKDIGFDEIVDGENIPNPGGLVGPFNSIPDEHVLSFALTLVDSVESSTPQLLVVETLWSHRPWMSPIDKSPGRESQVFKYVDEQLYSFYSGLKSKKYFEAGGILLITGDHRAMEPYSRREVSRFGRTAMSRVPMVVVADDLGIPPTIDADFQQLDILPSIEWLVSAQTCTSDYNGIFLKPEPRSPRCVMHARGDDRDLVFAKCGDSSGNILVDGEDTRFLDGNLEAFDLLKQKINYERLRDN